MKHKKERLYLIEGNGLFKFVVSRNINKRLLDIQRNSPVILKVRGFCPHSKPDSLKSKVEDVFGKGQYGWYGFTRAELNRIRVMYGFEYNFDLNG